MSQALQSEEQVEPRREQRPRYLLHLGLFFATCLTTTWSGIINAHPEVDWFALSALIPLIPDGLSFSASIMAILLSHEMGHYLFARYHGVQASLPYFLPVPLPLVGTMGAVIKMEGRIRGRNALADIGAAGPLAGLAVGLPVLAYGLHLSPIKPLGPGLLEGNSLLYLSMKYLVKGAILPGHGLDVTLHPMAWAGWVCLLITMINLMPIGQLDGGHIAFAYFGDRFGRVSAWLHAGLPLLALGAGGYTFLEILHKAPVGVALRLGINAGLPWAIWWLLLKLLRRLSGGRYHPPVGEDPLTPSRRILCLAVFVVFFMILTPIPLRITL